MIGSLGAPGSRSLIPLSDDNGSRLGRLQLMCLAAIGRVCEVSEAGGVRLASVDIDGREMTVGADLTPTVEPGMYVVVHAGMAIEALTPEEAADALALRAEIAAAGEEAG